MANKITEGTTLNIGLEYLAVSTGEDKLKTYYIKLPNPANGLTAETIKQKVQTLLSGENPLIVGAAGEPIDSSTGIVTAYTEYEKKTEIDIGLFE